MMKKQYLVYMFIFIIVWAGCSKKTEPDDSQKSKLAPQTVTILAQTKMDSEASNENTITKRMTCGEWTYDADKYHDWICLNGVLRCLNKDGCKYDDRLAPMRTYVTGSDHKLYCDGHEVPQGDLKGLRCLDEHFVFAPMQKKYKDDGRLYIYDENEYNDYIQHVTKNRYLVCQAESCGHLKRGQTVARTDKRVQMGVPLCEQTRLLPGTTCKDGVMYCGNVAYPGVGGDDWTSEIQAWRCINEQWLCVDGKCTCDGKKEIAGKFGTCRQGKAYCGEKNMGALLDDKDQDKGYICQKEKWICADPKGCGTCTQYQALNDKGKCEGKSTKPNIQFVKCEKGNCPCGDGACPKDGACLKAPGLPPVCACGKYHEAQTCYDRDVYPVLSNGYGEFTCQENHVSGSSGGGDYYWDVYCENKNCNTTGDAQYYPPEEDEEDAYFWDEDKLTVPNRYGEAVSGNDKELALELALYSKAFLDLEFGHCGRSTALEFRKTCAGKACDYAENLRDSCEVRKACDTMPVPRANRQNFTCDMGMDPDGPIQCYSWLDYDWTPVGLRCQADTGCVCHQDTCAKGQLCVDGVCHYDTVYAQNHCQNVYPHLAPDETRCALFDNGGNARIGDGVPGLGQVHLIPPSDPDYAKYGEIVDEVDEEYSYWAGAYDIYEKVLFWDHYSTRVENEWVTLNGTCLCGYSEVTPKKLADYKCVQSLGYVCLNPAGCACGNVQCQKGALCLREGVCSAVVMDKGLAPEKIGKIESYPNG